MCRDHAEKEVQNLGTRRAGNELQGPSRIKLVTERQPTPLLPQPLVSLLSARARDRDSSTDGESGPMQSRNSSTSSSSARSRHQCAQLDLEIAKRDALIASLQRRCAQLEMDVADDRQLEQLLDEYREKLDAAAEENRFLEEALKEERQNQSALREKIASYKERLAEWPTKLAAEIRALESQHGHHAKEAHLLVQRLEAEKRQLQDELQRSWDVVANLRSELARSQEEATRKQAQHVRRECEQTYRRALMELETQFDVYRQEAKRALERWETRCIDMEREHRELTELVAHYRSKSDELALSSSALEQRLRDQETHSAALLQRKSATVNQLESEVEALQNRIGDLQAVIDELEMRAGVGSGGTRKSRFLPA
ncbi:hypothetical protein CCYA_CCYA03G0827 [Cyanidiococcus yangmingshanensis]|nr:hypothetical protein CCYA_CCYA03G0827 [Cyanidiococcus yangmingshanensis]